MDSGHDPSIRPREIGERTLEYAVRAVKLCWHLEQKRDGAAYVISRQYLRSATSIGANVQESRAGVSRADFISKVSIAQKEARESVYWLKLLVQSGLVPEPLIRPLLTETHEILAILSAIIVKARRNS